MTTDQRDLAELLSPTPTQWVQAALVDVVAEAWDINLELPDAGDGDPLSDLDDALGTLAERLGLSHSQSSDDLRAAIRSAAPAIAQGLDADEEMRGRLHDAICDHGHDAGTNPDRWRCSVGARAALTTPAPNVSADALRRLRQSLQNLADTARAEVPETSRRGKLNVAIANARSARSETNVAARIAGLADDE